MVSAPLVPKLPSLPRIIAPGRAHDAQAAKALNTLASSLPVFVRIPSIGSGAPGSSRTRPENAQSPTTPCATRKRQRTEDARRQEREELKIKLEELQEQLSTMQKKPKHTDERRVPAAEHRVREVEAAIKAETSASALFLEHASRELHQYIASVRCMMSQQLLGNIASPVHPYVHLQKSMESRRKTILELKPGQMQLGRQFIEMRSQFLDITRPHVTNEWYISNSGDACGLHFFVDQLHGFYCVERAFAAAVAYASSYQVATAQKVSYMTYHDDKSPVAEHSHNSQFKVVTTTDDGPIVEANTLLFAQYDPKDNIGTVVATYVDKDDLRPFVPEQRIRQDVTAVLTVSQTPVGVVLRHWVHVRTAAAPQLLDTTEFGPFARRFESHRGEDVVAYVRKQLLKDPDNQ